MRIDSDEIYEYVFYVFEIRDAEAFPLKMYCGLNIEPYCLYVCVYICLSILKIPPNINRNIHIYNCVWLGLKRLIMTLKVHLSYCFRSNRLIPRIPQCIRHISHNTPFGNRNVHMRAHFCNKMVHCVIWDRRIVGFVRLVCCHLFRVHIDGLMKTRRNPRALAMELRLFYIIPSI